VTLSTGIFIVNGVLYFNLRSAHEHVLKIKETSVKIPGVQLPEPLESAKITGVYTAQADDKISGVNMVQEQDVDVDLDFAPADEGSTK
jgi:hypothetical protein